MKVSLNVRRETIDVRLEPEDGLSPREIQRSLRNAGIQFSTVSSKGQWELPSQQMLQLAESLGQFSPLWDARALERLTHLQEDNRVRDIIDGQASRVSYRLEYATSLGMKPYDEQWEAAELMSAPAVRRFALFWKPGSGKTGAMITAAHELLSREVVKGVLVVAERPLAMRDSLGGRIGTVAAWWAHQEQNISWSQADKQQRVATYQSNPTWVIVHYGNLEADEYHLRSWAQRNQGVERPIVNLRRERPDQEPNGPTFQSCDGYPTGVWPLLDCFRNSSAKLPFRLRTPDVHSVRIPRWVPPVR